MATKAVKITLSKKAISCRECRHYYETDGVGFCLRKKERQGRESALTCRPKKSWKKK